MSKVNFTLDITDEMIDEASQQLLKNKIRQAVNNELEAQLGDMIKEIVNQKVRDMMQGLNRRFGWGQESRKRLESIILEKIAEFDVSEETVAAQVNKVLAPVYTYATTCCCCLDCNDGLYGVYRITYIWL